MQLKPLLIALTFCVTSVSAMQKPSTTNTTKPAPPAVSKTLPKWELGIGGFAVHQAHYPGADQTAITAYPFPYFNYRGEFIRADRGGMRALLVDYKNIKLDFSLSGSLPVSSDDNDTRAGMPDLDPVGEIGPQISIGLYKNATTQLALRLPIRAAISVDFDDIRLRHEGWVFGPNLKLTHHRGPYRYSASINALIGDSDYHQYFYGVDAAFATPSRPAYHAPGGYGGTTLNLSVQRRWEKWGGALFTSYHNLNQVNFDNSPLLKRDHAVYFGIVAYRVLFQSKTKAVTAAPLIKKITP